MTVLASITTMKEGTPGSPFFQPHGAVRAGRARQLSGCLGNPVALDAGRTDPDSFRLASYQDANGLEVWHPAALPMVVGVANMVAGCRPFTTHGADPCHKTPSNAVIQTKDGKA